MTDHPPADLWPELGPICPATHGRYCRCDRPAGHDDGHVCGWCGEPFPTTGEPT